MGVSTHCATPSWCFSHSFRGYTQMTSDFPCGLSFGTMNVGGSRLGRSWHFYGLSEGITYFSAKCVHSQPVAATCNILAIPEQTVKYLSIS